MLLETEENDENLRIASFIAKIQNEHHSNAF
jgi:hypothetical protein